MTDERSVIAAISARNKYRKYLAVREQAMERRQRNDDATQVCISTNAAPQYAATMAYCGSVTYANSRGFPAAHGRGDPYYGYSDDFNNTKQGREKLGKQHRKAENKALLLMQNLIGSEQSDIYRKDHRVILKPNRWFWVIGNVFESFCEDDPFRSKPDVIRIDNPKKLHFTSFCVAQSGGGPTPYTDKVITFATHLMGDEKAFVKTVNRIREDTLNNMPECAVMK